MSHEHSSNDHSRRHGRGRFQLAAGAGGIRTRPARRRFRNGAGSDPRQAAAGRRSRRAHASRPRSFSFPEMAERIWRTYYIPGGKPDERLLQDAADAGEGQSSRTAGALHRSQLCRSVSRARRPRQSGGHQLSGKNPDSPPAFHLWRHARRCWLRPDGRGHPAEDSRRARSFRPITNPQPIRCTSPARRMATTRR